ncbi:MAG TPA: hypothetical protein VJA21_05580 [Verrucomicrobiae bacterium]
MESTIGTVFDTLMAVKKAGNHARRLWRQRWLLSRDRRDFLRRSRKRRAGPGGLDPSRWVALNSHTKGSVRVTSDRKLVLDLPERLNFDADYEATASHFQMLRHAVRGSGKVSELRFNDIKYISPSAALVLASEVDRWNQREARQLRADIESWDKNIERLLCQMGYFELLGIPCPADIGKPARVTFLRFKRGTVGAKDLGKLAQQLRVEIEALLGFPIKKHFLFEGLSEAITNVSQHAYPDTEGYCLKQWWLSASYDSGAGELCVMFYDQGAGIPGTLPKWKLFERVKDMFGTWGDSQKIEAAMEVGRSSSRLKERGKGLQNLLEFARAHREGRLSIYSSRGMYRMTSKRNGEETGPLTTTQRQDFENSVGGTLIEWSVKLASADEND